MTTQRLTKDGLKELIKRALPNGNCVDFKEFPVPHNTFPGANRPTFIDSILMHYRQVYFEVATDLRVQARSANASRNLFSLHATTELIESLLSKQTRLDELLRNTELK